MSATPHSASAVVACVAAAVAVLPMSAQAQTTSCESGAYGLSNHDAETFPVVSRLKAIDLPAKTDGYAPRCLVADAVAGLRHRVTLDLTH